jgi:predicted transcriptional regulator
MYRELSIHEKILMILNSRGAIQSNKAISFDDLIGVIKEDTRIIEKAILELINEGYVNKENDRFYITEKGIIRLMRSFS